MFDIAWSELLIVGVIALVVVGPKDLPKLMRMAGRWMAKARAMANEFRKSFDDMARQTELDELKREIDSLRNERPLRSIEKALDSPIDVPPTADEAGAKGARGSGEP